MADNKFLEFGADCVDILSDEEYSSSETRTGGVQSGIAVSEFHNKMYRQAIIMSSALGQAIADKGYDASDSDLAALVAAVKATFVDELTGKYSQLSGGEKRTYGNGIVPFTTEDHDDMGALDVSTYPTRITIPSGISLVRAYAQGVVDFANFTEVLWASFRIYKNGSFLLSMSSDTANNDNTREIGGYSQLIHVEENDYLELYFCGYQYSTSVLEDLLSCTFGIEYVK